MRVAYLSQQLKSKECAGSRQRRPPFTGSVEVRRLRPSSQSPPRRPASSRSALSQNSLETSPTTNRIRQITVCERGAHREVAWGPRVRRKGGCEANYERGDEGTRRVLSKRREGKGYRPANLRNPYEQASLHGPPRPTLALHPPLALPNLRILLPLQIDVNDPHHRRSHRHRHVHLQRAVRDRIVAVKDAAPERRVVCAQVQLDPLEEVGRREGGVGEDVGGDGGRRVGLSGGEGDRGVVVGIAEGARRFRVRGRRLRGGRGEVGRQRRVDGE